MTDAPFVSFIGHGAASLAPPGVFTGATSYAFGFRASQPALQSLVDTMLNPVGGTTVSYAVPVGVAMVTFMGIERCTSGTDRIGWEPGRECGLWIPLIETTAATGRRRIVLWTPYVFIDYTIGLLTGRDVWGWPKVGGQLTLPGDDPSGPATFGLATTLLDTLDPDTRARVDQLLTVTADTSAGDLAAPGGSGGRAAVAHLVEPLADDVATELVEELLAGAILPTVQLKQLRDSLDPSRACYQAVVDSPAQITAVTGGGPLEWWAYEFAVTTCESHQIVRDLLGREPDAGRTVVPLAFGAWLSFDFAALPGRVVASTT